MCNEAKGQVLDFLARKPWQTIQATLLVTMDYFIKLGFLDLIIALLHPRQKNNFRFLRGVIFGTQLKQLNVEDWL